MLFDKKKATAVILSKMGKDGRTTETPMAHESGEHNEYTSHAEDILSAVKGDSVHRLAAALKSYHKMIEADDEAQDAKE